MKYQFVADNPMEEKVLESGPAAYIARTAVFSDASGIRIPETK